MANLITDHLLTGVSLLCLSVGLSLCWPPVSENTDLNPLHCGYNRRSSQKDMCFRWRRDVSSHKTSKHLSDIFYGYHDDGTHKVDHSAMPFIVRVE